MQRNQRSHLRPSRSVSLFLFFFLLLRNRLYVAHGPALPTPWPCPRALPPHSLPVVVKLRLSTRLRLVPSLPAWLLRVLPQRRRGCARPRGGRANLAGRASSPARGRRFFPNSGRAPRALTCFFDEASGEIASASTRSAPVSSPSHPSCSSSAACSRFRTNRREEMYNARKHDRTDMARTWWAH
ncbi:hypothetical protein SORBI_3001G272200 [Sorghum bicolor]|uniref:Secreted protein n=1 Tax=Sorghum bicolor TaxID=4558 RepID=A0A1B6QLC8_SORBI|nr:hypothetical protein SORBI_3001G272200 [Sorghum bicolor]